jgi:hypothetical protein
MRYEELWNFLHVPPLRCVVLFSLKLGSPVRHVSSSELMVDDGGSREQGHLKLLAMGLLSPLVVFRSGIGYCLASKKEIYIERSNFCLHCQPLKCDMTR